MCLGWTPSQESGSQFPSPTSLGPQLLVIHGPQQRVGSCVPSEPAFDSFSPGSSKVSFLPKTEFPVSTLLTSRPGAHEAFAPNHSHCFCLFLVHRDVCLAL